MILGGGVRGVENAPVDERCRASKISCSSLGNLGGAGPPPKLLNGDGGADLEDEESPFLEVTEVPKDRDGRSDRIGEDVKR